MSVISPRPDVRIDSRMPSVHEQAHDQQHPLAPLSLHFATGLSVCSMTHDSPTPTIKDDSAPLLMAPSERAPLTVIVPTFNRAHFLQESLDSLIQQDWRPESILCVDDGSTDDTRTVIERYGADVRYVGKPNGGKSSALNLAIPMAESEFVWIFDDDDIAYPWAVSTLLPVLLADPSLDFVFGGKDYGISGPDGKLQFSHSAKLPRALTHCLETQRVSLFRESFFQLSGTIVRRTAMNAAGAFREDLVRSQDYEFLVRLAINARFAHVDRTIYLVRLHEGERGPARNRSRGKDRQKVWRHFDSAISVHLRREETLKIFSRELAELVKSSPVLCSVPTERFTRITRAWVLATKSDLSSMSDDLLVAFERNDVSLSGIELDRLADLMNHHYFVAAMPESIAALLRLHRLRKNANGRQALRQFSSALYWQSRKTKLGRQKAVAMMFSFLFLFFALIGRPTRIRTKIGKPE